MNNQNQTVTIKKYANRRLYNTATSSYVTLDDLSTMVKEGTKFCVYDAKSSEDITRTVLTQIIVEEESKPDQGSLLPINFLRQLISFYGSSLQWMVPKYLEHSMDTLFGNQDKIRNIFTDTFGTMFPFTSTFGELGKQNMAMFENTLRMFSPMTTFNFGLGDLMAPTTTSTTSSQNTASCCSTKGSTSSCCTTSPMTKSASTATSTTTPSTSATSSTGTTSTASTTTKSCPITSSSTTTSASVTSLKPRTETRTTTPMPNVQTATAANIGADDMQQKIANLQRQLADLAKSRA